LTFLYYIAVSAYHLAIRLAAIFGVKQAVLWVAGRQEPATPERTLHLRARPKGEHLLWMHCASLGEFEQGRPVLEEFREARPHWKVLLTFYSPSGYERCKNEPLADYVAYLPADGPKRAAKWIAGLKPDVAIFVKYEFWFFHLRALKRAGIPTFLVAASFRPDQPFFKPWGSWWRRMLSFFTAIIVQTDSDRALLTGSGKVPPKRVTVAGDPRMDRTLQLASTPFTDETLAAFTEGDGISIIAGSVWPQDVACWLEIWNSLPAHYRLVLAPHQLHEQEIADWAEAFGGIRYTKATEEAPPKARVLVLDTIGILSRAYRYGDVAYIGGAFKTGLHNTLEPMAYGLPVIFGPRYHKFPEAIEAIKRGGAVSISSAEGLSAAIQPPPGENARAAQRELCAENAGAGLRTAQIILQQLEA